MHQASGHAVQPRRQAFEHFLGQLRAKQNFTHPHEHRQCGERPRRVGTPERREEILAAMEEWRQREGLAFFGLMVTDVVTGTSRLLTRSEKWINAILPYTRLGEGEYDIEGMVSRKKQLVPALSALLDESR